MISSRELAFLGDAVFELHIRERLLAAGGVVGELHHRAVGSVRASSQAWILRGLEPMLTDEERDVVRRARNSKGNVPRSAKVSDYRQATGFEALLGYLHLQADRSRLYELLARVDVLLGSGLEESEHAAGMRHDRDRSGER